MLFVRLALVLSAVVCLCASAHASTHNHHVNGRAPPSWEYLGDADQSEMINVHFALHQTQPEKITSTFLAVSDVNSPSYGKYVRPSDIAGWAAAREEHVDAMLVWLESFGPLKATLSSHRDFISVTASVFQVQQMIGGVRFQVFQRRANEASTVRIVRTLDRPVLPAGIEDIVEFVGGISSFPRHTAPLRKKSVSPELFNYVTPDVLFDLYNITNMGSTNVTQALAEWESQSFSPSDLAIFQKKYGLEELAVGTVVGDNTNHGHMEANLDVQYIMAMAQNVSTAVWLTGGADFDILSWLVDVEEHAPAPWQLVWSVSYGEDLNTVNVSYASRVNIEFQKMGAVGVSVMIASGDTGVYSRDATHDVFQPGYPASLPAVTAVGATQLNDNGTETTSADFSGGGFTFSNYFTRNTSAPWQVAAADAYLNGQQASGTLPPSNMYDADGVGFPDVSAMGVDFLVIEFDVPIPVSGTSCASPTFAGVISLLNDYRVQLGRSSLGFLNPLLYANPGMFNDITHGENSDDYSNGFRASKGWDPTSGMGTPSYSKMREVVAKLP